MTHVVTLVVDPNAGRLEDSTLATVREAIAAARGRPRQPDWLAVGVACDIAFANGEATLIERAVRAALGDRPVDVAVLAVAARRKELLVADMESTLIKNEMLDELADIAGLGPKIADITRRAMNGEIDFADAVRERVALLKGLPAGILDTAAARIVVTPGAATLVRTMRASGAYTVIVSGGFRRFTRIVRRALDADEDFGNELELDHDVLTGRPREPILGKDAKLDILRRLTTARGLAPAATLVVGDGANDIPMLQAAGLGVAFHAKPATAAAARVRVDHCDLTALLYFQGYRESELIA